MFACTLQGLAPDATTREWVMQHTVSVLANQFQEGSLNLPGIEKPEKDL